MNINDEIEKATQAYLESDKLKEHIQAKAEKMINELVDDSFGYFGGIKKTVEEAMKNEIHINIKELGLSGFNTFITDVIKEKLNKSMRAEAEKRIGEEMEKILTPIDKVVSIQTLKEELLAAAETYSLDIYEGDVVIQYDIPNEPCRVNQEIFFADGMFCVGRIGYTQTPLYLETNTIYRGKKANLIEVIGNKFENPELLEKK